VGLCLHSRPIPSTVVSGGRKIYPASAEESRLDSLSHWREYFMKRKKILILVMVLGLIPLGLGSCCFYPFPYWDYDEGHGYHRHRHEEHHRGESGDQKIEKVKETSPKEEK